MSWLFLISIILNTTSQMPPEEKAVQYLSREVPNWSRDNHCFSCHNNGDGARALYVAMSAGFRVPDTALSDTTSWLMVPEKWDNQQGGAAPGFSDKRLARIEFGNALLEAFNSGVLKDKKAIEECADSLISSQDRSGAWTVDEDSVIAAPARYGPVLATYMARRILSAAGDRYAASITRANEYLRSAPATSVMNAAALVMAFADSTDVASKRRMDEAVDSIMNAQSSDGGWGPYPKVPTEPFDTAIALLALVKVQNRPGVRERIIRGREYLIGMQLEDGGWIETTRPAGGRSYAEHISTCGWATLALIQTRSVRR